MVSKLLDLRRIVGLMEEDEVSGWWRFDFGNLMIARDEEGSGELGFGSMEGNVGKVLKRGLEEIIIGLS